MKRMIISAICATTLSACGPAHRSDADPAHGLNTVGVGLGNLILAPFMVVTGLLEGIASLPVFLSSGVHELNRTLVAANAQVNLDDVYRGAYDTPLKDVADNGDTGAVFHEMRSATVHFQSMLHRQGVKNAQHYLLTAVRSADRDGYTLYAVVRRAHGLIEVRSEYDPNTSRTLSAIDLHYYRPYARDAQGRSVDEIVDWAGLPRTAIATQKGQAILLNLAANSVLNRKRSNEYWRIERRWMTGDYRVIAETQQSALRARMGLS
jgi:hypothetical protein